VPQGDKIPSPSRILWNKYRFSPTPVAFFFVSLEYSSYAGGYAQKNGDFWLERLTRESGTSVFAYMQALFMRLVVVNSNAATAEHTFLIAFISILAIIGMVLLGDELKGYFENLATALNNAAAPTPDPFAS
jgi:Flp pilus assembly pilin Flp